MSAGRSFWSGSFGAPNRTHPVRGWHSSINAKDVWECDCGRSLRFKLMTLLVIPLENTSDSTLTPCVSRVICAEIQDRRATCFASVDVGGAGRTNVSIKETYHKR